MIKSIEIRRRPDADHTMKAKCPDCGTVGSFSEDDVQLMEDEPDYVVCDECCAGIERHLFRPLSVPRVEVPDEDVVVRFSQCKRCTGTVRYGVLHAMSPSNKAVMTKEAIKHDLAVREMPLLEWRRFVTEVPNCDCD